MDIKVISGDITQQRVPAVIVNLFEGGNGSSRRHRER